MLIATASGYRIGAADCPANLDLATIVSAALVDVVKRSGRTIARAGEHSFVLAPIAGTGLDVGVLCVVRMGDGGFTSSEVTSVELAATELGAARAADEAAPGLPRGLRRDTILDVFGDDDAAGVVWGAADGEDTEADGGPAVGPVMAFGSLTATPFISPEGLRDLLGRTVTKLLETTGGHVAAVVVARSTPFTVLALAATADAPNVASERLVSRTLIGQVLSSGLPLLTHDAQGADVASSAKSIVGLSVSTVMCVPLTIADEIVGALYTATFNLSGKFDPNTLASIMADARALAPMLKSLGQLH